MHLEKQIHAKVKVILASFQDCALLIENTIKQFENHPDREDYAKWSHEGVFWRRTVSMIFRSVCRMRWLQPTVQSYPNI